MNRAPRLPSSCAALLSLALVLGAGLAACGGDEGSELLGIWQVTAWSENPAACDSPGDSVLDQMNEQHLAVFEGEFFGVEFVQAVPCGDPADCQAILDEEDTLFLDGYIFESGSDEDGWTGRSTFASEDFETGDCVGTVNAHTMRPVSAGLEIDTIRTEVSGFGKDEDGFCDTDAAAELAEGEPCTGRELLTATRVE